MKNQKLFKTVIYFCASTLVVIGCQKAPSKKIAPAETDTIKIESEEKAIPAQCSSDFLNKAKVLNSDQTKATALYEKLTLQKDAELNKAYLQLAKKQVENCQGLVQQMHKEKITSCLKIETETAEESVVEIKIIEENCKNLQSWNKSISEDETPLPEVATPTTIRVQFNEAGQKLLQTKNAAEFLYFSRGEIKSGKDSYKQDALAGNIACVFSNQSEKPSERSAFKYVAESKATSADIGFEFKGNSSLITLQDDDNAIISVVCLNVETVSMKDRADSIKKLFGNLITLEEASVTDIDSSEQLTEDTEVAPALELVPVLIDEKNQVAAAAAAQEEKSKNLDQTMEKAQKTIQVILKDSLAETKKTAVEISKDSIAEAQKASSVILAEAEVAGKNLILQSQTSAIVVVNEAKSAAQNVVDQSIQKSQLATAAVIKNGIAEAKTAANEVVDLGIKKTQKAAVDTVKSPFRWVKEKATNTWNGFAKFFSSKDKKTIQSKPAVQKK